MGLSRLWEDFGRPPRPDPAWKMRLSADWATLSSPDMLSFVIPAYNEEVELPATLSSIHAAARNFPGYEIIVANDASLFCPPP